MLLEKLRKRRSEPTPADLEAAAVAARYAQWQASESPGRETWPPPSVEVYDPALGIPDIPAADLTPESMASGIRRNGALIVRGLLPTADAAELRSDIDRVFDLWDAELSGRKADFDGRGQAAWLRKLTDPATSATVGEQWRSGSSMFAGQRSPADSPHVAEKIVRMYSECGLTDLVAGYLGERPALSLEKWTLRRVPPTANTSWHQDGAFLGETVRTVNVWIALSDCGIDASGLDIVPQRFDEIVETGTGGAYFNWDVGTEVVERVRGDKEVLSPVFAPGDAVIFDQYLLHRTGVKEGLSKDRYALEAWFFAPSHFPENYHGLLV